LGFGVLSIVDDIRSEQYPRPGSRRVARKDPREPFGT
jgi:hypothetical protein